MTRILPLLLLLAGCASTLPARTATSVSELPGVSHATSTFEGEEGVTLFEESWRPQSGDPKAALVIVHGLKDYGHRYEPLAAELSARGIAVYAFDLPGHGHSGGQRAYVDSFDVYGKDLARFFARVSSREPGKPLFLMGHSMGGAIATLYALDHGGELKGLILSAAALAKNPDVGGGAVGVTRFLSAIAPSLRVLSLDDSGFSRDPKVVASMKTDPLIDDEAVPARTAAELLGAMEKIQARASTLSLPLLVLHGTADKITPPSGSKQLVDAAASKDKELVLLDGTFHDLAHEPNAAEIRARIASWLDAHVGG